MYKSIQEVIEELKTKSRICSRAGAEEVYVEKELLKNAGVYLEDYMLLLESLQEAQNE